jgi:hypothetical protein
MLSFPTPLLTMRTITEDAVSLGLNALALVVAIKSLSTCPDMAIEQVQNSIEQLSQFPEPDVRRILRQVRLCVSVTEWQALRSVQSEVEARVLA